MSHVKKLSISALPALKDNYIWLIQNPDTHQCAVVDPGIATPVLKWLAEHPQWQLTDILITHHHADHTEGIASLKQHSGARILSPSLEAIPNTDLPLQGGESIEILGQTWQVLSIPGHTLDHLAYYGSGQVFSGDTLFAAGCGRIFEGTMGQMFQSLHQLSALPQDTLVYCAHEYTLANLAFAQAVEPDNQAIQQRIQDCQTLRAQGLPTLPSNIELERATNPFLRTQFPKVRQAAALKEGLSESDLSEEQVFSILRMWKNTF